jgi:hypothetical protein
MSTSEYLRAALAATAMWIALLGAMSLTGNRPSVVERSSPTRAAAASEGAQPAPVLPVMKVSTGP